MVELFERVSSVQAVGTEFALKGGGVAGGLVLGSKLGNVTENLIVTPVIPTSPAQDKWLGWGANNVPKALAALGLAKIKTHQKWLDDIIEGGVYGLAGGVGIDTLARLTNKGAPVAMVGLPSMNASGDNAKIQALLAENAQLKASIDKLSIGAPLVRVQRQPELPNGVPQMPYKGIQDKAYQFAGKEVASPEVLVRAFGFSRGE